jgi:hypothetical protein
MKLLRHALLAGGYFAQWTDVLERTARERGRPRKKLANDEDFERFYTVPTASTARDRLLLLLKRDHPEHFAEVCKLKLYGWFVAVWGRVGGGCAERTRSGEAALRIVRGPVCRRPVCSHRSCIGAAPRVRPRSALARR